jgi:hypothetical protein
VFRHSLHKLFSLRKLFRFEATQAKRQRLRALLRPRMELLEDRAVPAAFGGGSIQGQDGWSGGTIAIAPQVVQAVDVSGANAHFGVGAWQVSNSTANGGYNGVFAGWPFGPGLSVAAGQPSSGAGADRFSATYFFKSASNVADGSNIEIDLGTTTGDDRNTFMAITNRADGVDGGLQIRMAESDVAAGAGNDYFYPTQVVATGITRGVWHRIDIQATFTAGDNNDTFQVSLDGGAPFTNTTPGSVRNGTPNWGTFEGYRNGHGFAYALSNRLYFRSGADPSSYGAFSDTGAAGFYFDDVSYKDWNSAAPSTILASYATTFEPGPAASTVYVNSSWTNVPVGTDPDGAGPATAMGYDAFTTIQGGINGVTAGGTVNVSAATYAEQLTITKALTLNGSVDGSNNPTTTVTFNAPGGGDLVNIQGAAFTGTKEVAFHNFAFQGNGANNIDNGIDVASSSRFDKLTVDNSSFRNFDINGVSVTGDPANAGVSVKNVVLNHLTFTDNGYQNIGGAGDIDIFTYNGAASLTDLTLSNIGTGARGGIQFRGVGSNTTTGADMLPMGTASFSNVDVSGKYVNYFVTFQRYFSVANLSFNNVQLGGAASQITGTFGALLRFDAVGAGTPGSPATVNLGNTYFRGLASASAQPTEIEFAPDNGFAFLRADATNTHWNTSANTNVAAGSLTLAELYEIEDRILHYPDFLVSGQAFKGFADVRANNAYITGTFPGSSIQRAVDIVATPGTINVKSGSYAGTVDATAAGRAITLSPGSSPGQVTITGDLTLDSNDAVTIEIAGASPSQYDNLVVSGTVSLGGATINLSRDPLYTPTVGTSFKVIDGSNPIVGTFANLPDDSVVTVSGTRLFANYQGGDGNDLTLAVAGPTSTITATSPASPLEGSLATVSGNVSDPAGPADTITVNWTVTGPNSFAASFTSTPFAGSAGGVGTNLTFTPPDNGNYTVVMTAHDQFGDTSAPVTTVVAVANVVPTPMIVDLNPPYFEGTPVTVHGTVSDPGDGNDTPTLNWTVFKGAATTAFATASGSTLIFTPDDDANYTIRLVANDEDGGGSSTASTDISVSNVAPVVTINAGSTTVNEGTPYTVTLGSFDPGADTISKVVINWGDGNSDTVTSPVPVVGNSTSLVASHTYADGGAGAGTLYTISATVSDEDGTFANAGNRIVTVANVLPSPTIGAVTPAGTKNEGSPVTVVGTATDPAGANDTITLSWVATNSSGSTVATQPGTVGAASSFTFTPADGDGNYTVTLIARDEDGGTLSAVANTTIAVANVAPQLTISGNASATEGSPYTLTLASSDPGTDTITRWLINWGDGTGLQTVTGNPVTSNSVSAQVTHTFADGPTSPVIFATASDEDGSYSAASNVTVTVNNVAPTGSISGAAAAQVNVPYTLSLRYDEPGTDTVTKWVINWGDGQTQTVAVNLPGPRTSASVAATASHTYTDSAPPNPRSITATLFDEDNATATVGYPLTNAVSVAVANTVVSAAIEGTTASLTDANPAHNSRSNVHSVTLNFSGPVNTATTGAGAGNPANYMLSASPFVFTQAGAQPFTPPAPLPTISVTVNSSTQVVLTFSGNVDGGSLKDGDYRLSISGIADANSVAVAPATVDFRRLFGDANGNGRLDFSEFAGIFSAQGSRVGDANYNPAFDFDSDGDVDVSDQLAFFQSGRFAQSSAAPPMQYPPVA